MLVEVRVITHPSGQLFDDSTFAKPGFASRGFPLTDARAGLQQQYPSVMQQAIAQASSSVCAASVTGARVAPSKIAAAPMRARSLLSRFCNLSVTVTLLYHNLAFMSQKKSHRAAPQSWKNEKGLSARGKPSFKFFCDLRFPI